MSKICFMWLGGLPTDPAIKRLWINFFNRAPKSSYRIITHTRNRQNVINANWSDLDAIKTNKHVKTRWANRSLVDASMLMMEMGYKDKSIKKFVLLSGSDIPLYNMGITRQVLLSDDRSWFYSQHPSSDVNSNLYLGRWSQWVALDRKLLDLIMPKKPFKKLTNMRYTTDDKKSIAYRALKAADTHPNIGEVPDETTFSYIIKTVLQETDIKPNDLIRRPSITNLPVIIKDPPDVNRTIFLPTFKSYQSGSYRVDRRNLAPTRSVPYDRDIGVGYRVDELGFRPQGVTYTDWNHYGILPDNIFRVTNPMTDGLTVDTKALNLNSNKFTAFREFQAMYKTPGVDFDKLKKTLKSEGGVKFRVHGYVRPDWHPMEYGCVTLAEAIRFTNLLKAIYESGSGFEGMDDYPNKAYKAYISVMHKNDIKKDRSGFYVNPPYATTRLIGNPITANIINGARSSGFLFLRKVLPNSRISLYEDQILRKRGNRFR